MGYITGMPYIGSKKKFVKVVNSLLHDDTVYIEPFSGGFSLGLSLYGEGFIGKRVYNDLGFGVSTFYQAVHSEPDTLCLRYDEIYEFLCGLEGMGATNVYPLLSERFTRGIDIAILEYMRRSSSRGVLADCIIPSKVREPFYFNNLVRRLRKPLSRVEFFNVDYKSLAYLDSDKTFWFFDPPYEGYDNEKYYGSASASFCQATLANFIRGLKGDVLLIVPDTAYMRELYSFMTIQELETYSLAGDKFISELVISKRGVDLSNYPQTPIRHKREPISYEGFTFGDMFPHTF